MPDKHAGKVIEFLGQRRGELVRMETREGHVSLEFRCPSRGLIGIRTKLLNQTQGEAVLHHTFHDYEPDRGPIGGRTQGVLVSIEEGQSNAYAMFKLKDRGAVLRRPRRARLRGHDRRASTARTTTSRSTSAARRSSRTSVRPRRTRSSSCPPPRRYTVEEAIEYIDDDELVEVTPDAIRMRKMSLRANDRKRDSRAKVETG